MHALTTIEVEETELVNLQPNASDPDADTLEYSYSSPLNEKGEWKTTYGDAGQYNIKVSASDGINTATEDVLLIVHRKEMAPTIESYKPSEQEVTVEEGKEIIFEADAFDLNKDPLSYRWELDGSEVSRENAYIYRPGYDDQGDHTVKISVRDANSSVNKEWNVHAQNVDREGILNSIQDATVMETETARLKLPDFAAYGLSYTISDPLGNDNEWKTGYDGAGVYTVDVTAFDKDFKVSKEVKVTVLNKDREPNFKRIKGISLMENQQLTVKLEAIDPDNDPVTFSVENMPPGASLAGDTFAWPTSYDTVQKKDFLDKVFGKFHLLSKTFPITFIAESNGLKAKQIVDVKVKDVNRPLTMERIEDIMLNEGDALDIRPKATDPDGDKVYFSYRGWVNKMPYTARYEDAGTHKVTVLATDGWFEVSQDVKVTVNDINQAPVIQKVRAQRVAEGNALRFDVKMYDPEGSPLNVTASLPDNATFFNNVFIWRPDYDTVAYSEKARNFTAVFQAADENTTTIQAVTIEVLNKNKKPRIIAVSPGPQAAAQINMPVLFFVNATDQDGQPLAYEWGSGFLGSKIKANESIQRIFRSPGEKKVKVTVSDGEEKKSFTWRVKVI